MELVCKIQNYSWGRPGSSSAVAQLAKNGDHQPEIDDNMPYAEFWMGTHVNAPSLIKDNKTSLSEYIKKHPECLGSNITSKFGNQLCFLFKVLSVNQALSIQAHPEKSHAEKLHKEHPQIYKDDNHKPEMAIALTPFKALCGFRPAEEITFFIEELPELRKIIGEDNVSSFIANPTEEGLKHMFSALMNASKSHVIEALNNTMTNFSFLDAEKNALLLKDLFLTLHSYYPGDVGCFSIYLLNYIFLQPGESLFLGHNIIHAYLLGDCIECMACSDNVVRAGLTPKFQDVDTLLEMLDYQMLPAESRKFKGKELDSITTLFNPPVPDFAVQKISVKDEENQDVRLTVEKSASIMIVIKGKGQTVAAEPLSAGGVQIPDSIGKGSVVFIEAEQALSFRAVTEFLAFRALCV